MTIRFIGWYGRRNRGDEAFKEVHRRLFPDESVTWFRDEADVITDYAKGDVFVLGGGDVFQQYYLKRIPPEAKFFIYGVGLGRDFASVVPQLKGRLQGAWLRNKQDVELLKTLGIETHYTPDITFQLRYAAMERPVPEDLVSERKKLVFIPSNGSYQQALRNKELGKAFYHLYLRHELAERFDFLAQYYDLYFLPFSFDTNDNDRTFVDDVYSQMQRRKTVTIVDEEIDPLDAARFIASAQLVMAMRFHGVIFSTMVGTPFINLGVTHKTMRFCQENGLTDLVWPATPREDDDFMRILKIAENPATRKRLSALSATLTEEATRAGRNFREAVLAVHEWDT